ncbi:MAG TPA: glycosyltransferase family protein [Rhodothermia bacterium]|nr:glycosyltransferase family protein [Rhodothermia bacterium]
MRCLFIIQGEGRGHMTQAIAMKHLLEDAGHSVCGALVGTSPRRVIPPFFIDRIGVDVVQFESPNFVADAQNRGILIGRTILQSFKGVPKYIRSFGVFRRMIRSHRPDLVVNFYEPLFGLYEMLTRRACPSVCIAHQCLSLHPDFPFPSGHQVDKFLLKSLTRICTARSSAILGLSFTPLPTMELGRLRVVPPLLRPDVFDLEIASGDYLLVYLMSQGYGADVTAWHEKNPEVSLHCFWDKRDAPETDRRDATLTFHRISDTLFLSMMAGCRGLVTTAGFESVCEAMYFGKPVLMIPVHGHYEQLCNAVDGERAGAGVRSDRFELDPLMSYLPAHRPQTEEFRDWVGGAPERILPILESMMTVS